MPDVRALTVDLTPMLVGADNGGAKIFVLELLSALGAALPNCQFTLVGRASTRRELFARFGDRMNIVPLLDDSEAAGARTVARRAARAALSAMPAPIARRLRSARAHAARWRLRGSPMSRQEGHLWYCPFTSTSLVPPGAPAVATIYDLQYRAYPQFFGDADRAERDRNFREAARRADALAAISRFSRDEAVATGLVPASRVTAIPIQIGRSRIDGAADVTKLPASLKSGRYLLYPANFWPHKNHELLLTAFAQWASGHRGKDLALVCTGAEGPRAFAFREAARRMGLAAQVHAPGFLPDAVYAATLAHARAVVFPSLYEGFGMPVIEAMAAGVPVACGDRTALPEVTGDAALLFDPRKPSAIVEAIGRVAFDDALRSRLVTAGRARAAAYADPSAMADDYVALFSQALAGSARRSRLHGRHADGWAGALVEVARGAGHRTHRLSLVLSVPAWHPHAAVDVVSRDGRRVNASCPRGATLAVELPPDVTRVAFGPTFRPVDIGLNRDTRVLSVLILSAEFVGEDGSRSPLVEEDGCTSPS
ncbi:MAG: glycosyltransferase family 4 protein [Proteobacteria bacterium]|nr:glycosyltransferase family 4 protein [Pseudomonadota bacterium]